MSPVSYVRLRWIDVARGGRTGLPGGPAYATTAHFDGEPPSSSFSVVIEFPPDSARREMTASLRLLAPENLPDVARRIVPGAKLVITEGARPVAEADVVRVTDDAVAAGAGA